MNNKRRFNSAEEVRREAGYHFPNRNPNEYRYNRDNQNRDGFRQPYNSRDSHRSPRYGSEATDYHRSPRQETETRDNHRSPRQDFEARDHYRSPRSESETRDNQQSPRPDSEPRDDNRRRGSVHDPRDQKRPRYDWKTERISELEKINEEMKAELASVKEDKERIQKNYDREQEGMVEFKRDNEVYKDLLKHDSEAYKQSFFSAQRELETVKELNQTREQQIIKLLKESKDLKNSNQINIKNVIDQKDGVIRKLNTELRDERLKNNSNNKLNQDLKTATDKCDELEEEIIQLKNDHRIETTKLKNNFNSQIVSLKRSKKYFQTWNEKNKRIKLAVLYKQKRQELMYKKNPRVIYEATEGNAKKVWDDFGEQFMALFKNMNKDLNNKNLDSVVKVIKCNTVESKEIEKGKKIMEERQENDRIMCPQPNCGKTFACGGDFCKHMALKHFMAMNDEDIPSKKSHKKRATNPEVIEINDTDIASD